MQQSRSGYGPQRSRRSPNPSRLCRLLRRTERHFATAGLEAFILTIEWREPHPRMRSRHCQPIGRVSEPPVGDGA